MNHFHLLLHCVVFLFSLYSTLLQHAIAKWFSFPHFLHCFPKAGHFDFSLSGIFPQNLHCSSFPFSLFAACLTLCTSSVTCPSIALLCSREISIALHTCRHLSKVRLSSLSSLSLQLELCVPHTIRSLISDSFSSPKLQVLASILRSVTYLSIGSPGL